jgi:hypothetical protein
MFSPDFREFIELLIKNKAEYLIVVVTLLAFMNIRGILAIWIFG